MRAVCALGMKLEQGGRRRQEVKGHHYSLTLDLSITFMIGFLKYISFVHCKHYIMISEAGISPYPDFEKPDFVLQQKTKYFGLILGSDSC